MTNNNKKKKKKTKGRCVCGDAAADHVSEVGVCVAQGYDASGIPQVCWCNEYKEYKRSAGRKRSLSTATRRDPQPDLKDT